MSIERVYVSILSATDWAAQTGLLCQQADLAFRRQLKAPPGDASEGIRYRQLCEQVRAEAQRLQPMRVIELLPAVAAELDASPPHHPWMTLDETDEHPLGRLLEVRAELRDDVIAFEWRRPLAPGFAAAPIRVPVAPPSEPWRPTDAQGEVPLDLAAAEAQRQLWHHQLSQAATGSATPLVPSGITNRILTEGLRAFVAGRLATAVHARVVYRDGSEARTISLRAVEVSDSLAPAAAIMRMSLMSMRHPEMDALVDGAILRNRLISKVRPAAETDELAYTLSRERLGALSTIPVAKATGVTLYVYQTGLQPAVMGFYRALIDHLAEHPGPLAVVPCFWRGHAGWTEGRPWAA